VASLVAVYPCGECRVRAAANEQLQQAIRDIRVYATGLRSAHPHEVADALSIHAFKVHNLVNADVHAADEPTRMQVEMMGRFMERMERGDMGAPFVASMLRARWAPVEGGGAANVYLSESLASLVLRDVTSGGLPSANETTTNGAHPASG